jgi:hypothetical protein
LNRICSTTDGSARTTTGSAALSPTTLHARVLGPFAETAADALNQLSHRQRRHLPARPPALNARIRQHVLHQIPSRSASARMVCK